MRLPSKNIVVDANIILSAALGLQTRSRIARVGAVRNLVTSAKTVTEALTVVQRRAGVFESDVTGLHAILDQFEIVEHGRLEEMLMTAGLSLRNGPASKNGSTDDAHILATAWLYEADIWSHDRDFCGIGWPVWSSANLLAAVEEVI